MTGSNFHHRPKNRVARSLVSFGMGLLWGGLAGLSLELLRTGCKLAGAKGLMLSAISGALSIATLKLLCISPGFFKFKFKTGKEHFELKEFISWVFGGALAGIMFWLWRSG